MEKRVVCLGRYGDIANALPIAYRLWKDTGEKPKFFVAEEFQSILDGVSYVRPMVWKVDYKQLPLAIERMKGFGPIICQTYKHPDQSRKTDSFQKEAWRHAGWLEKFGTIPLVFDQRSTERENALADKYGVNHTTVLVAGKGVSSPLKFDLWNELSCVPNIVNLSEVQAEKVYDIIGLIERAKLLVTIDTAALHFSRATNTKVVALINDGWFGSVPPPNSVASIRYSAATPELVRNTALYHA
jgi:hypothetical protein